MIWRFENEFHILVKLAAAASRANHKQQAHLSNSRNSSDIRYVISFGNGQTNYLSWLAMSTSNCNFCRIFCRKLVVDFWHNGGVHWNCCNFVPWMSVGKRIWRRLQIRISHHCCRCVDRLRSWMGRLRVWILGLVVHLWRICWHQNEVRLLIHGVVHASIWCRKCIIAAMAWTLIHVLSMIVVFSKISLALSTDRFPNV